ncbi:MAG TPA: IS256 family transposase [Pyrinomonadaceae bacterium]|jgi:putative transposase
MREGIQFVGEREGFFGPDRLSEALRGKVREVILTLAEAELSEVLAALPYERKGERRGYRNGKRERWVSTGLGATAIELPRGRLSEGGQEREWQSVLIERYQRRARSVDSALLGCYLSGANGRRIRGALSPLLRGAPLSKSAVSRIVGRLEALFTDWRKRSLEAEAVVFLYLDAICLRVRIANKVVSAPVLVALAVKTDGQKVVLDLELLQSESSECWGGFVEGLVGRGLKRPRLVIIDGNKGLRAAVEKNWPGIEVQRCTVHKLRNLERHVPRHALEEVKSDYHRIIQAESLEQAKKAYREFGVKWKKLAPKVLVSLEEAGQELLTFYGFPNSQWKSLRTTNAIERLNGEFRRRVKTQGSLPTAQAAELLLFGVIISGQIRMRRIDGWQDLKQVSLLKAA